MAQIILGITCAFFGGSTLIYAQAVPFGRQVEDAMEELLGQMEVESETVVRVYIQPPVCIEQDTDISSRFHIGRPFARHLRAACEAALPSPFRLIPRDELTQIWAEVNIAQVTTSPEPDKVLEGLQSIVTQQIMLPLDVIVIVEYSHWLGKPKQIQLNLYLIDVRRVRKHTTVRTIHLTAQQAAFATARPEKYEQIRMQAQQMSHIVRDEVQAVASGEHAAIDEEELFFNLFITVDKGAGSVYIDGEALTLQVSTEIDCYIAVINMDATGEMRMLFPNGYERNNFIRAEEGKQIPQPNSDYRLGIGEPFGLETIKVFASRTPFAIESVFQRHKDLNLVPFPRLETQHARGTDLIRQWTKALVVEERHRVRLAEAQCLFTTMPRSARGIW